MRTHRRNDNNTGLTLIDNKIPTLTIAGTKDGLYRITRAAEGYFHSYENIDPSQKGRFPVVIVPTGSHATFMDESLPLPSNVKKNDLKAEIS